MSFLDTSTWIKQANVTSSDVITVLVVSVLLHNVRIFGKTYVLCRIGSYFGITRQKGMDKFCENLWYTIYYIIVVATAFIIFRDEKWFFLKYNEYFTDFPAFAEVPKFPALHRYYLYQLAFYVQSCFALVLWDTKRKDFLQYVIHHAVTIALILFSYGCAQHRIGATIMLVHDLADIFLSGSKTCNYIDLYGNPKRTWPAHAKNIGFGMFTLVWLLTRNTAFPFYCIWPAIQHFSLPANGAWFYKYQPTSYLFTFDAEVMCVGAHCLHVHKSLIAFLCVLEVLHIVWLYMIIRMILRAMTSGLNKDVRSDPDEDDDLVEEKIGKKGTEKRKEL